MTALLQSIPVFAGMSVPLLYVTSSAIVALFIWAIYVTIQMFKS